MRSDNVITDDELEKKWEKWLLSEVTEENDEK
jgi:hypothetical protein